MIKFQDLFQSPFYINSLIIALIFISCQPVYGQATYIVNSTDDLEDIDLADTFCADKFGNCTLRAALQNANISPLRDIIHFDIPGKGPMTIFLMENLPMIKHPIDLDGTTQRGYSLTSPQIVLNGENIIIYQEQFDVEKGAIGLNLIEGSSGSRLRGFVIGGFMGVGIFVHSDENIIQGNFIGTLADGVGSFRNATGIFLKGRNNLVGGHDPKERNLISGNAVGIFLYSKNKIIGNYIGTSVKGTMVIPNDTGINMVRFSEKNLISENVISGNKTGISVTGDFNRLTKNKIGTNASGNEALSNDIGIRIVNGFENIIGGSNVGNLISGNGQGIVIESRGSSMEHKNLVIGNYIGTDITGFYALGNYTGILIKGSMSNVIGGPHPAHRNVISGNLGPAVELVKASNNKILGNFIGLNALGNTAISNLSGIVFSQDGPETFMLDSSINSNLIFDNRYYVNNQISFPNLFFPTKSQQLHFR